MRVCFDQQGLEQELGTHLIQQLRRTLRLTCRALRQLADAETTAVRVKVGGQGGGQELAHAECCVLQQHLTHVIEAMLP